MIKRISTRPDWLKAEDVADIYSVSNCVSVDFMEYLHYWKHNGYGLFDSLEIAQQLAQEHSVDLKDLTPFYYEVYELEFDEELNQWATFTPDKSLATEVKAPPVKRLAGFDVVSFSLGNQAECSPLSCNHLAEEIQINRHCLFNTFAEASAALTQGKFLNAEPGPYRIFAVYTLTWP